MSGHTPGPWVWRVGVEGQDGGDPIGSIVGRGGVLVCDYGDGATFYPTEGARPEDADLALMLAAPKLLAACRALVEKIESEGCVQREGVTGGAFSVCLNDCGANWVYEFNAAEAAIAEAEGQP